MRITKNEQLLLSVLIAIAFAGGNYFGYSWLAKKQSALELSLAGLRADQAEAKVDLLETDQWKQRMAWVHDHEPAMTDAGETHAAVLTFVKKGAQDNKLVVLDQRLNDMLHSAAGMRMSVSIKVKGSMQDLAKWLSDLQKPDQFYAISTFSLKTDEDQKSMDCTLRIARYFKE